MREKIRVTDVQGSAVQDSADQCHTANQVKRQQLTPQQMLEARNKLVQTLQMSLIPAEILTFFFHHIQLFVTVDGLAFKFSDSSHDVNLGRRALHHCDYRLNTDEGFLGEIFFSRAKRFLEDEFVVLEQLMGLLIYPLRNALRYQTAVALAMQDSLTGLGNRLALDQALQRELQLAERYNQPLSLLMVDIDHFKKINDQYGHSCGDKVLQDVSRTIQSVCRECDITFRYGGEEFVVLLNKTHETGALIVAERIRKEISQMQIISGDSVIKPTVSIGVGTHESGQQNLPADLFERADKALYFAKGKGGNRVMSAC